MLFQDVDVIWNKDPVKEFKTQSKKYKDFDILFMDDGKKYINLCLTSFIQ